MSRCAGVRTVVRRVFRRRQPFADEQLLHRAMGFVDGLIDERSRAASEFAI
jgi:hypothetical protein